MINCGVCLLSLLEFEGSLSSHIRFNYGPHHGWAAAVVASLLSFTTSNGTTVETIHNHGSRFQVLFDPQLHARVSTLPQGKWGH